MSAEECGPVPTAIETELEMNAENARRDNTCGAYTVQGDSPSHSGFENAECSGYHGAASPEPGDGAASSSSQPGGTSGADDPQNGCSPGGDGTDGRNSVALVSWLKRVNINIPERSALFKEFIDGARDGRWAKEVQRVRKEADKDKRRELKKLLLPAITASGTMTTREKGLTFVERYFVHSGILQIDIDRADNPNIDPESLVQELKKVPEICAACVSPSGDGVKAFVRVRPSVEHHRASFAAAEELFTGLRLKIDPATKDLTRACFVTYDPGAWYRDGTPVLLPVEKNEDGQSGDDADCDASSTSPSSANVEDIRECLSFIPPFQQGRSGCREYWLQIVFGVARAIPRADAIRELKKWSPEWNFGEYAEAIDSMDGFQGKPITIATLIHYASMNSWPWHVDRSGNPLPRPRPEPFCPQDLEMRKLVRRQPWYRKFSNGFSSASHSQASQPFYSTEQQGMDTFEEDSAPSAAYEQPLPETHATDPAMAYGQPVDPSPLDDPELVVDCLRNMQRGDAELWCRSVRGWMCFDHLIKRWRFWDGTVWKIDDAGAVRSQMIDQLAYSYGNLARWYARQIALAPIQGENPKDDPRVKLRKLAEERRLKVSCNSWISGSLTIAEALPDLCIPATEFDRRPYLLAVENGVIDFETVEVRAARAEDMLTHKAPVFYDPSATCPKFIAFLNRMLVDPEVVGFVLRAMAYSLTGSVDEDMLFFCHGSGANGKSTFIKVFEMLLGDLMTTIDIEVLLARKPDQSIDYKKAGHRRHRPGDGPLRPGRFQVGRGEARSATRSLRPRNTTRRLPAPAGEGHGRTSALA